MASQSLFSTDIISRGDSGVKLDSVLGSLFLEICLPMMIISLIAWGFYMCLKRRRSNDRRGYWTRLEEGRLSSDEKSKAAEETVS